MMEPASRERILALAHEAHALTETAYRAAPAVKGDALWLEKQRILLADMALHVLQTALRAAPLDSARLQQNLYAVLTVSAPLLPELDLARYAQALLPAVPELTIE